MMWNWTISVLSVGAALVLFDGSPFKPTPLHLWELVDSLKYYFYMFIIILFAWIKTSI